MKLSRNIQRTVWPLIATLASLTAYFIHPWAFDTFDIEIDRESVRLVTASLTYFAAAWLGGRLVGIALERAASSQRRVPKLLQELISAAFFLVALVATIMLILGHSISGALASSGLVIAVLGFAIRNVVADALSGIALGLEAPYRIGDWVDIDGDTKGRIVEIGWRTTRLLTRDATYMILPNSQIARQRLTNYSAPRRHYRAQVQVTLTHELPANRARDLLTEAARRAPMILQDPLPDVRVIAHGQDGITYVVRYWVPSFAEDIDCRDAVLSEVDAILRENGVPAPYRNVRIVDGEAATRREGMRPYLLSEGSSDAAGAPLPDKKIA